MKRTADDLALETYEYLLDSPLVKRLREKNRQLRKENKQLVRVLVRQLDEKLPSQTSIDEPNVKYQLFEVDKVTHVVEEEEAEVEEVEVEEEEEEEVEEEEEEEVEEEEEEVEEEEAAEELEVFEVCIRGKSYFATSTVNGDIYAMDDDGDVGDKVGQYVNGKSHIDG